MQLTKEFHPSRTLWCGIKTASQMCHHKITKNRNNISSISNTIYQTDNKTPVAGVGRCLSRSTAEHFTNVFYVSIYFAFSKLTI